MIAKGTSMIASIASAAIVLGLCASMAAAISCDRPDISGVWVTNVQAQLAITGDDVQSIDALEETDFGNMTTCFSVYSEDELSINRDTGGSGFATVLRIDCEDYIQNGEYTPEIDELSDDQTAGSAYSLCVWEGCSESHALICAYGESGAIRKLFLETDDDGNIEFIQNIWIQSADASPDADFDHIPIAFESIWVTVDEFLEMYGPDSENDNGDVNDDDNDNDNN